MGSTIKRPVGDFVTICGAESMGGATEGTREASIADGCVGRLLVRRRGGVWHPCDRQPSGNTAVFWRLQGLNMAACTTPLLSRGLCVLHVRVVWCPSELQLADPLSKLPSDFDGMCSRAEVAS